MRRSSPKIPSFNKTSNLNILTDGGYRTNLVKDNISLISSTKRVNTGLTISKRTETEYATSLTILVIGQKHSFSRNTLKLNRGSMTFTNKLPKTVGCQKKLIRQLNGVEIDITQPKSKESLRMTNLSIRCITLSM